MKAIHKYSWFTEFAVSHPEHKHDRLRVWNGILKFMDHNKPSFRDTNNFVHRKQRRRLSSTLSYVPAMLDGIICQDAIDILPLPFTLP